MKTPPPVLKISVVRHLQEEYRLSEKQSVSLAESACTSIITFFSDLEALETTGSLTSMEKKRTQRNLFHGLKGVFLHMGEGEWADFVRGVQYQIEKSGPVDLSDVTAKILQGTDQLLNIQE